MPIEFDGGLSTNGALNPAEEAPERLDRQREAGAVELVDIALVNNMPDAALRGTERQFVKLLRNAAGRRKVRLRLFSLPEIARGDVTHTHLREHYSRFAELFDDGCDALIVTGTEPRAAALVDEPYWRSLAEIVDWAEHNTLSAIWSCLAAHAAVLHLDGIKRRPFPAKCSGVFACAAEAGEPLLAAVPAPLTMPHSRWNDLGESDLVAHGYRVLARSAAGVDLFAKDWRSRFVFLQGHPEYATDALALEYRRDVGRYLRGESGRYPAPPVGYFDARSAAALAAFRRRAERERDPEWLSSFPKDVGPHPATARSWQASAVALLGNWLADVAARKEAKGPRA